MSVKTPRPRKYDVEKWDTRKLWCSKGGFGPKSCKCEKPRKGGKLKKQESKK